MRAHDDDDRSHVPLPSPEALRHALPVTPRATATVRQARAALRDALHGRDAHRLVVVVGPCSIHDADAAREYAARLAEVARTHADALLIVMRTYFEKPRTTVGWKGWLRDPHLDGSGDVAEGLRRARALLREVNALGLACGSELLDPMTPPYLADLLAWASVGARTVESQVHREMASGLAMPVGFKNPTDGRLRPAADAARSAAQPHVALGVDAQGRAALRRTRGNPDGHLVLRGGERGPNHGARPVSEAVRAAEELGLRRGVLVDCSHANSGKSAARQPRVCREVLAQVRRGATGILGLMLESHLEEGHQPWSQRPLRYGVSVTDECLAWDETEALLAEIAAAVRAVREGPGRASGGRSGASSEAASARGAAL